MQNPLVSVIIPNYCHAKYLDQRIQSVLDQTYQNFEIIILDDCSPDDGASRAVIEKYRSNPHVSHIEYNETNSGSTFKQWHKGFALAKGDLIWIAESDDYCEKTLLEKCVEAYESDDNVALVHATSILVDADGKTINIKDTAEKIPNGCYDGRSFISTYMCTENAIWNASAVVFRKDYASQAPKGYMDYKAAGDHLFWVELAEQGKVVHLSDHLSYFRQHQQKVTPGKYRQGITHMEEFRTVQYIKQKGLMSPEKEKEAFLTFIPQIRSYKYDNEQVRAKLLKTWKDSNSSLYRQTLLHIFLGKIKAKLLSILR